MLAASLTFHSQAGEPFTVHEWGTFTSVQGADGVQLVWTPTLKTDLPDFVYSRDVRHGGFKDRALMDPLSKGITASLIRMETPVIYFYSDRERTADVRVRFPQGRVTEWYPQATHIGPYATTNKAERKRAAESVIEWNGLKILPRKTQEISDATLIREPGNKGENHYYAAREVNANFLRMSSPHARTVVEYERDLFYRGIGFFQAPLHVNVDGPENQLRLSNKTDQPLTDLFVLTVRQGMASYQYLDQVHNGSDRGADLDAARFAPLSEVRPKLMGEMAAALIRKGLYAKEAEAMVNTWKDQWFSEEGTRVLYLLPEKWTEATLPLEISPRADKVVRVMVGRSELITPAVERELAEHITNYRLGNAAARRQIATEVRAMKLGRFLEPATRKALGKQPDNSFQKAAWDLANEAGHAETAQPKFAESPLDFQKANSLPLEDILRCN